MKKLSQLDIKKLCETFLVGLAGTEFIIFILLMILEHETSKIMLMGLMNVIASFFGLLFVMFTLVKNLKRIHRTSYMILGVIAFLLRGTSLFLTSLFYKNPTEELFITNETDNALLYSNFIWMATYTALFYVRPAANIRQFRKSTSDAKMTQDFN